MHNIKRDMDNSGQIREIASRVFNIDKSKITNAISRDNPKEWDSFNHLLLITEIERAMKIKFTISEVEKIKTFCELKRIIAEKKRP